MKIMAILEADTAWVRRAVFVGFHFAIALSGAILVISPVREVLAARDAQIASQQAMLARLSALVSQEPKVDAAAKQTLPDTGEFLPGANEGVITADLQTRLKGMVESAGGRVRAVRVLPTQTVDQVRYVGSRVELQGSVPAVHRAIAAMEGVRPYLFVRAAVLKPAPPTGRPDSSQEPLIDAELDVFGALRPAPRDR
jgi:Type II secretion system (T2SS), protein M subtype b